MDEGPTRGRGSLRKGAVSSNVDGGLDETTEVEEVTEEVDSGELSTDPEVTEETDPEGEATETESLVLDVTQYGDHLVTMKVDGEEIQVPLSEAISNGMRQADYTRKTQEIAAHKQRLAAVDRLEAALREDPKGTLKALEQAYGIGAEAETEPEGELDPLEAEVKQLRQWQETQEAQARREAVDNELAAVRDTHKLGDDFDDEALFAYAIENRIPSLDVAYRAMSFEQRESAKETRKQEVTERKRQAPKVEGGARKPANATTKGTSSRPSIEEAWELAKAELA